MSTKITREDVELALEGKPHSHPKLARWRVARIKLLAAFNPEGERCGGSGIIDREVEGRALPIADECPGCPDCNPEGESE